MRFDGADTQGTLPTWIFQRGGERLMLHCRETGRGVTLVVSGNDDLRSYSFHDFAALVKFESEMAEFLIGTGWSPARLTVEVGPSLNPPKTWHSRADAPGQRR